MNKKLPELEALIQLMHSNRDSEDFFQLYYEYALDKLCEILSEHEMRKIRKEQKRYQEMARKKCKD